MSIEKVFKETFGMRLVSYDKWLVWDGTWKIYRYDRGETVLVVVENDIELALKKLVPDVPKIKI